MVVLFIIGIASTAVVMTVRSPERGVRDEAEQFALELVPSFARLAQAQIFTGSVRGLRHFEDQRPIPIGLKQPREHPA